MSRQNKRDRHTEHAAAPRQKGQAGYWMYGLHAVTSALKNPHRQAHELLVTREAAQALSQVEIMQAVAPQIVDRSRIDPLCGRDAVHQGIALRVAPLAPFAIEDLSDREGTILILDQVTDPRNIGAILRSAAAFNAAGIILQDRHAPQESGVMAKAASGALDVVPVVREVNLSRAIAHLQKAGYWVIGLDTGGSILSREGLGERRAALVLGAEGEGLRRLTREHCDEIARLHMQGDMESLNVSVAASVALYELARP
ncbi:23S rRNA (guanosine(2251)-2'-O)-methyltransferase RlmB [Candidatus Kirkpatrickella diaphorinae]|uniref:23S rRNA (Guanosine(2251)-2'-O)-methyltransferase RlmB n=1 Tax=Candidatus Kirkpatrickella diaphorinae TaxID=2984322 RepID=A0ABY6GI49_9PROT|nr:23S rRNA (guanosine(2251)-2'-O)-methyltransferase RlmB [Candidatus Kirkpatrickella diaphorinae]UYH50997.1 23S rRNA (guanosine(2251)-2'-O)-methyltransferase RlmB [Candidatus Kirkpatrickella diaphorinae]